MPGFHLFKKQVFERGGHFSYRQSSSSSSSSRSSEEKTPKITRATNYGPQRDDRIQYSRLQGAPKDGRNNSRVQRRSSPKSSTYEPSHCHSGNTLMDHPDALLRISTASEPAYMRVGEDIVTVSTQQMDEEESIRQQTCMSAPTTGPKRCNTAPSVLHSPVTTLDGATGTHRALSHPQFAWGRLNVYRRVRCHQDRKEARRGKVPKSEHSSSPTPKSTPRDRSPMPSTPQYSLRRNASATNISPRTSVEPPQHPRVSTSTSETKTSATHVQRKDSHFPDAVKAKEKSTAEFQASVSRQLSTNTTRRKRSSFFKHPFRWLRNRSPSASSTSSSSGPEYIETKPLTRHSRISYHRTSTASRSDRQQQEIVQEREMHEKELDTKPYLLPPGFSIPEYGTPGPSEWLTQSWKDHDTNVSLERKRAENRQKRRESEEKRQREEVTIALKKKRSWDINELAPKPVLPPGFDVPGVGCPGPVEWVKQSWKQYEANMLREKERERRREGREREERKREEGSFDTREEEDKHQDGQDGVIGMNERRVIFGGWCEEFGGEDELARERRLQRMRDNQVCVTTFTPRDCEF